MENFRLIFDIILQTFKELTNPYRLINDSSTIADWTKMSSPTSPNIFREYNDENKKLIIDLLKENKFAIFLRKVDRSFPDSAIKEIMNIDFNHKYHMY